ncbi:MAG: oligopeptide/dipeptide ABC transporter ATP-binding protein, partial [Halanaerobiales bacterium]
NLLKDIQQEMNLTYLFIAHDLSVIEHISDRVMVMYLGKIVEIADSDEIYSNPSHPYTEALLKAIPVADPRSEKIRLPLAGSVPNPANPPSGCNFHTRCPYAEDICKEKEPELEKIDDKLEHYSACHFFDTLKLKGFIDNN